MLNNKNILSLYEYLGHAAGPILGKKVAQSAIKSNIQISSHEVNNNKYTGKILKYPKQFLEDYFQKNPTTKL